MKNELYPILFSPGKIGRRTVKNRIVMSPMGENMGNTDGSINEHQIAHYAERAKGGAGIILTGVVSVEHPRAKSTPCEPSLSEAKFIVGWERMAREVHRYGALLIPQLHHAGMSTDPNWTDGVPAVRVSPMTKENSKFYMGSKVIGEGEEIADDCEVLTHAMIKDLEQKFVTAAVHAQLADCDGVEIHGAHGYLIAQFLNPVINGRTDEYGGSIENRARFAVNVIKGIREACGPDFIIGIRIPVHKFAYDEMTDEDSIAAAKMFVEAGADYLNVSVGFCDTVTASIETGRFPYGHRIDITEKIKKNVDVPVFCVGKLRTPEFCEDILAKGICDHVVLGRALLADPEWPKKAQAGKANEIRPCISCLDACYGNLCKNQGIRCVVNPELGYDFEKYHLPKTTSKKVVIVGGGIGGLQAAITARKRGHEVVLLEATERLGGQLNLATLPPHKEEIRNTLRWFCEEAERQGAEIKLNCKATPEVIMSYAPDHVILATGSNPWAPPIEGIETAIPFGDVLEKKYEIEADKKVVVIGGGVVGCETADFISENGASVTILEMLPTLANGLEEGNRQDLLNDLRAKNVGLMTGARIVKVESDGVTYQKDNVESKVLCDCSVIAAGRRPGSTELKEAIEDAGIPVTVIGDAVKPSKIVNATKGGYFAAINI